MKWIQDKHILFPKQFFSQYLDLEVSLEVIERIHSEVSQENSDTTQYI